METRSGQDRFLLGTGGLGWRRAIIGNALVLLFAFGVYAYVQQFLHGELATGMRSIGRGGASWGVYIAFYIYFVGVSFAGITVAAFIRLFSIKDLEPLSRMAVLMTIITLLLGSLSVLADLGRPEHGLLDLPRLARPTSPFFGTFSMVVGAYLFASLVFFFLEGRADAYRLSLLKTPLRRLYLAWATGYRDTAAERDRHHRVSRWLSLAILPLLVTATSTLGFVFGIQAGRPGWFSALQAPGFVVMAAISGTGMLCVLAAAFRQYLGMQERIRMHAFQLLGNLLWVLILIYLYFIAVEELTASYAALALESSVAHEVVSGTYAWIFWTVVATLAVPFLILFSQFARGRPSIPWIVVSGLLVNVAAILRRYLIVVPSQTHGVSLPYQTGTYAPNWIELGVISGLFAAGALGFYCSTRIFPILPKRHPALLSDRVVPDAPRRKALRYILFWSTLILGVVLAVVGFLLSARFGTEPYLDPILPFSPVMFIFGMMLSFASAIVYETLPRERRPEPEPPLVEAESTATPDSRGDAPVAPGSRNV